jgi:hypothetical protein
LRWLARVFETDLPLQGIQVGRLMPITKTTMTLRAVLLLYGTAHAADDCSGEIRVGHGWDNLIRNPDHNEQVCFFTYKWKDSKSRNDIPEHDAMQIEEVCAPAMVGNDKEASGMSETKFNEIASAVRSRAASSAGSYSGVV